MKEEIRTSLLSSGALAVGFSKAGKVPSEVSEIYESWIGEGKNGDMEYLARHIPLRKHTDNVLQGAKTVISLAFPFYPPEWRDSTLSVISCYAYGEDYHEVIKKRLYPIVIDLKELFGGEWRICVDSAPLEERFWAMESGLGIKGLNGTVIVEGCGSYCFLAEILTTLEIPADKASKKSCQGCNICIQSCPGKAIIGDGTIDARKCISYLTIEKKGLFTPIEDGLIGSGKAGGYLYGCDLCLRCCPLNKDLPPTSIKEFIPKKEILELKEQDILEMDETRFRAIFKNSAIRRRKLEGLKRNIIKQKEDES